MIEFLLDGYECDEDRVLARGIVSQGDIRLGSRFSSACPTAMCTQELKSSLPTNVAFIVKKIVTYRQELDELPQGMTGELWLVGEGLQALGHGVLLRGENAPPPQGHEMGNPYQSPI
jgi:hypothetical protein